jgi:hypothetical protein
MTQYRLELLAGIVQSNVRPRAISLNALYRAKGVNDLGLDPLA